MAKEQKNPLIKSISFKKTYKEMLSSLIKILIFFMVLSLLVSIFFILENPNEWWIGIIFFVILGLGFGAIIHLLMVFFVYIGRKNYVKTTKKHYISIFKYLLVLALLIDPIRIILTKRSFSYDMVEKIITISWTIFGIAVTAFAFYYALFIRMVHQKKNYVENNKSFFDMREHNINLNNNFFDIVLLIICTLLLILSTNLSLFFDSGEDISNLQVFIYILTYGSVSCALSGVLTNFLDVAVFEKNEAEFKEQEISLEKERIEVEFAEIEKLTEQLELAEAIIKKHNEVQEINKSIAELSEKLCQTMKKDDDIHDKNIESKKE